jgi:NDP-4-keto-2,6-dideoxyhexose 3-C-methyltransferase
MPNAIERCRICANKHLVPILDLGEMVLSGVFPQTKDTPVTKGPLVLVKCVDENSSAACGLVQLKHSYGAEEMYGENYGYRSGLNRSMVEHLRGRVQKAMEFVKLSTGDLIIDIGSNDSTLLQSYPADRGLKLVGIDPTGIKFKSYYPEYIDLIPDFFSAAVIKKRHSQAKAKIVTSIAMFYDLESPGDFMRQVEEILDDEGIWVLEQSYMPAMLEHDSYDTICHEHLEYYTFKQIKWMADAAGLKVIDIEFNDANGGSFAVTLAKAASRHAGNTAKAEEVLAGEMRQGLSTLKPFEAFKNRILGQRDEIIRFVKKTNAQGKTILGYGASTKGNIILQLCGFTPKDLPYIAEVNQDKFGRLTPGTHIPIISETQAKAMNPDYFLVLPWHFKNNIIEREQGYLNAGGALVFPLPKIEIVRRRPSMEREAS